MTALRPQSFAALLGRALAEHEQRGAIFDLPRRSFWRSRADLDLSVRIHGEWAATPAGPAAGPHTQMAQNLVLGWLAGARVFELKTVQRNDRITVPRPCIDAATIGYNVEWSQELPIEQSLEQYAIGWYLIHILAARGVTGAVLPAPAALFEASIGYHLDGICSAPMARFLDTLHDGGALLERLRDRLPHGLRPAADVPVPARIVSAVTLSTFHGCPPGDVERMVEHLFARHRMHVVIKLNPTLLGWDAVNELLRGRLGYDDVLPDRKAFETDARWDEMLALFERLERSAARHGLSVGAKLTNTLVIRNASPRFTEPIAYLSGRPLHVLAMTLAERFARETGGRIPLAFSAGIEAENFAEAVACGFAPVTACTDLLRPTGYRRLPRYLKRLEEEMTARNARTIADYVIAVAGPNRAAANGSHGEAPVAGAPAVRLAALANLAAHVARLPAEPRYHAAANRAMPIRTEKPLAFFDCDSCNACLVTCPNDAFFSVPLGPRVHDAPDLVVAGDAIVRRPGRFALERERQWVVFADFCNDCGNCETFCPEPGGPQFVKPRVYGSLESLEDAAPRDGIWIGDGASRIVARLGGRRFELERGAERDRFGDGTIEAEIDAAGQVVRVQAAGAPEGSTLPLVVYFGLRDLGGAIAAGINPVTADALAAHHAGVASPTGGPRP